MYAVDIANEQVSLALDEEQLCDVARAVLAAEQVREAEISIAIVDDVTMRELNRRHLEHDYDTDVLSFLLECEPGEGDVATADKPRGRGKRIEGEVIASADMAVRMAANYGWRPIDELTLYVVHGLLHLAGYDDLTDAERGIMRARECEILAELGLSQPSR